MGAAEALTGRDPRQVGRFVLLGRLGSGAMGRVFLARAPEGQLVAVKIVHDHLANEGTFRERFRREVAAARRVSGPRTAAVIDADPEADPPWMAVEYVEGPTVEEQVRAHGVLPVEGLTWLASGVALALQEIHGAGVIHRDLKPTNVLLSPDGPRVIDFGIARAADVSALTTMGMVTGSPAFMSPEQAVSGTISQSSDVFAFGSVLFFAATGRPVFGAGPPAAMLYRVVHNEADVSGVADPEMRALIAACLQKDPASRPALGAIRAYCAAPAGSRDPRMLAGTGHQGPQLSAQNAPTQLLPAAGPETVAYGAVPATRWEQSPVAPTSAMPPPAPTAAMPPADGRPGTGPAGYRVAEASGSPLDSPTRVGRTGAGAGGGSGGGGGTGTPGRRRTGLILAAVAGVLVLAGVSFGAVQLIRNSANSKDQRAASPVVSATSAPASDPATTDPEPSETEDQPSATAAQTSATATDAGPTYLYDVNTGVNAVLSGTQRSFQGLGFDSANSTSFRVGCDQGAPFTTLFDNSTGAKRFTGTLLLDPQTTPPDLVVQVTLSANGQELGQWTLGVGQARKASVNLRGGTEVELDAVTVSGTCGLAAVGYGVVVDGALT